MGGATSTPYPEQIANGVTQVAESLVLQQAGPEFAEKLSATSFSPL
jgi:hypothetical protein